MRKERRSENEPEAKRGRVKKREDERRREKKREEERR